MLPEELSHGVYDYDQRKDLAITEWGLCPLNA